ncbi:MAG: winged helix-turn-helix transcriptional regulator [Ktedonobacterales bacterium]
MRYSEHICVRYQQALNLLSRRWVGLIVRVLLDGPKRFNELASSLQVVADRVLAERLRDLEAEGIVSREVFIGSPVRVEYTLTEKGRALAPVLDAIETWSHDWIPLDTSQDGVAAVSGGAPEHAEHPVAAHAPASTREQ